MGYRRIAPEVKTRVLSLAANGYSGREIAELCGLSRGTVARLLRSGAATAQDGPILQDAAPAAPVVDAMTALGHQVPVKNARDLLAMVSAQRQSLKLAEENGQVVSLPVIRAGMMEIINVNYESFGPKFWRWCHERGMDYEAIRDYAIQEESALVAVINKLLQSVGIESLERERNDDV